MGMIKLVAYSCLLAAVALAAPSGKELTVKIPKCSVTFEEIESESCIPKAEKVCDIKTDCREVTKQVCVPKPNKVTKTVPVTSCHIKQSVDCTPVKSKIPKRSCEEVETKVVAPVFGYHG